MLILQLCILQPQNTSLDEGKSFYDGALEVALQTVIIYINNIHYTWISHIIQAHKVHTYALYML